MYVHISHTQVPALSSHSFLYLLHATCQVIKTMEEHMPGPGLCVTCIILFNNHNYPIR